jgi:zona occludens toxin
MITVITGAPGSGKTLYVIAKLLKAILGTFVDGTDDKGNKVKHPRTIFSNCEGLALPHEKIDAEWLNDWHNRVKPGAVIFYDEAQKPWPKRVTGSKVPPAVQELETHRHKGVDFIIATQKPELVDQNVCSLAGRHLHIRRVGNSHNAIVYEWDAVSRGLLYRNAFMKSAFRYPRWVFDWYKSADAHTKMPRKVPFALWIALAAIAGSAYAWPALMSRITKGLNPEATKTAQAGATDAKPLTPSLIVPDAPGAVSGVSTGVVAGQAPALVHAAPTIMGCAAAQDACRCYDQAGQVVELEPQICRTKLESPSKAKTEEDLAAALPGSPALPAPPSSWSTSDAEVMTRHMRSSTP